MSAFMCSSDHIAALADTLVALSREDHSSILLEGGETPEILFKMLVAENAMSLEARYPSNWHELIPGKSLFEMTYTPQLHGTRFASYPYDPVHLACVLKALDCYAYQACEHRGWESSRTNALVSAAQAELAKRLASCHPAYEDAAWGWRPTATLISPRRR